MPPSKGVFTHFYVLSLHLRRAPLTPPQSSGMGRSLRTRCCRVRSNTITRIRHRKTSAANAHISRYEMPATHQSQQLARFGQGKRFPSKAKEAVAGNTSRPRHKTMRAHCAGSAEPPRAPFRPGSPAAKTPAAWAGKQFAGRSYPRQFVWRSCLWTSGLPSRPECQSPCAPVPGCRRS